jgi:hypothetical protein
MFKGTGSRNRFLKIPQQWTGGLGLKKGHSRFLNFSEAPPVLYKKKKKFLVFNGKITRLVLLITRGAYLNNDKS